MDSPVTSAQHDTSQTPQTADAYRLVLRCVEAPGTHRTRLITNEDLSPSPANERLTPSRDIRSTVHCLARTVKDQLALKRYRGVLGGEAGLRRVRGNEALLSLDHLSGPLKSVPPETGKGS